MIKVSNLNKLAPFKCLTVSNAVFATCIRQGVLILHQTKILDARCNVMHDISMLNENQHGIKICCTLQ